MVLVIPLLHGQAPPAGLDSYEIDGGSLWRLRGTLSYSSSDPHVASGSRPVTESDLVDLPPDPPGLAGGIQLFSAATNLFSLPITPQRLDPIRLNGVVTFADLTYTRVSLTYRVSPQAPIYDVRLESPRIALSQAVDADFVEGKRTFPPAKSPTPRT